MNTISTFSNRRKYLLSNFDHALRNMLVAEKVCAVDHSLVRFIDNPYGTRPTAAVQSISGTYGVTALTITDDLLTVSDEVIVSEQIYDFEATLANFDLFAFRIDDLTAAVAIALDKWVLNNLLEDGTGVYTTPTGGFTTAGNVIEILSNIVGLVAGWADSYNGLYVIVENTDLPGIVQAQAGVGFSFADMALNNGFVTSMLGVDIYCVRSGTYVDATTSSVSGSKTWTNAGHRCGGVKNVTTYCAPRGIQYDEKGVTGKTGKEVVVNAYVGFKAWTPRSDLTIDITLA